jgi:hypothetical protein
MKEVSMRWPNRFRTLLLISGFFIATGALAQSQVDEIGPLPTTLSTEQLQLLAQPSLVAIHEPPPPRARRRLPKPGLLLTPEEISYREAIQKLGVHKHRFVHCELANRKVRTGVITEIRDDGFILKDGIIVSQWIRYTDLNAAPRPVAAVGTRIGHGLKWTGVVVGCVAGSPLILLYFVGLASD